MVMRVMRGCGLDVCVKESDAGVLMNVVQLLLLLLCLHLQDMCRLENRRLEAEDARLAFEIRRRGLSRASRRRRRGRIDAERAAFSHELPSARRLRDAGGSSRRRRGTLIGARRRGRRLGARGELRDASRCRAPGLGIGRAVGRVDACGRLLWRQTRRCRNVTLVPVSPAGKIPQGRLTILKSGNLVAHRGDDDRGTSQVVRAAAVREA
jgi:hypothetical protein